MTCFKAVCLFSSSEVHEICPSASMVDTLNCCAFLHASLRSIKSELPAYLAAFEDVSPEVCPLEFWKRHKAFLPITGQQHHVKIIGRNREYNFL